MTGICRDCHHVLHDGACEVCPFCEAERNAGYRTFSVEVAWADAREPSIVVGRRRERWYCQSLDQAVEMTVRLDMAARKFRGVAEVIEVIDGEEVRA